MSSMLDRAFFRIRSAVVDAGPWIGSWQLSVVLMVTAAFWNVLLAVFAFLSPPHVVHGIAGLAMFWLLYAALAVNTVACIWTRRKAVVFHVALLLIMGGFVLTALSREEAVFRVAEGEEFVGDDSQIVSRGMPRLLTGASSLPRFRVLKIEPELWRDQLLFTRLEATLDGGRTTRINRPLILGPATFLRLSGFGFTPRYEILDGRGIVLESAFVKMNIFPPGRRDYISADHLPFRFYITAADLGAKSLNVIAYRGKLLVAQARLARGQAMPVEGLRFRIAEMRTWGELTLVRDAGAPLIVLGLIVALAALVGRLR